MYPALPSATKCRRLAGELLTRSLAAWAGPPTHGSAYRFAYGPPPSPEPQRVVVTGIGLVTPLGCGVNRNWDGLLSGASGIRALDATDMAPFADLPDAATPGDRLAAGEAILAQLRVRIAGVVPADGPGAFVEADWGGGPGRQQARFVSLALAAAAEAVDDAQWAPASPAAMCRTGVAIGGGMGSVAHVAAAGRLQSRARLRRLSPHFVPTVLVNSAAGAVSLRYGLRGPSSAPSTACASGAHAIGDALRMLRHGEADVVLAGGTEAAVDPVSLAGFAAARALAPGGDGDPSQASRPFDASRRGFVLSEGACVLVLETADHAAHRGVTAYAELRSCGASSDAHHPTAPPPGGDGAASAMRRALTQAGLTPEDVDYVNAHATATPAGDAAEAAALAAVFGRRCLGRVTVSSTKGHTGHLLGAAGAAEAAVAVLAIRRGWVPGTRNLGVLDGGGGDTPGLEYLRSSRRQEVRVALSNSFGFGGTNTCLAFSAC